MFEAVVFYSFGGVLLLSGLLVITARNPVHGALFLVLAFFTAAAIWLLLHGAAPTSEPAADPGTSDPAPASRLPVDPDGVPTQTWPCCMASVSPHRARTQATREEEVL